MPGAGPGSLAQVHICITMRHSDSAKTREITTLMSDKNSHICDFQSVNLDLMSTYKGAGEEKQHDPTEESRGNSTTHKEEDRNQHNPKGGEGTTHKERRTATLHTGGGEEGPTTHNGRGRTAAPQWEREEGSITQKKEVGNTTTQKE